MRRPLVIVAVLYVCGLLLAEFVSVPLAWLLLSGIILAGLAVVWTNGSPWVLPAVVVLTGWANLAAHTQILSPHDLRLTFGSEPEDLRVRGTLRETPSVRMFLRDEEESFRTLALLDVTEIQRQGTWLPVHGRVMSLTPGDLSPVACAGSRVEVRGIVATPPLPAAPGLFDYRAYLRHQDIWFQLRIASTNDWRVLHATAPPLATRFVAWAQGTLARGLPTMDEPLRLLYSMTLGWKTGLTNDTYEPFMQSGTIIYLSFAASYMPL